MKKTKSVLLINPPQYVYSGGHGFNVYHPVALCYLAAAIKGICDVEIFDALLEQTKPIGNVKGFKIWAGATPDEISRKVSSREFSLVGISAQFSSQLDVALYTARIIRESLQKTTIVIGGAAATVHAGEILTKEPVVDIVVLGEGELPLKCLVNGNIDRKRLYDIPNIVFRNDDGVQVFTSVKAPLRDLDSLGSLPYELLDMSRYLKNPNLYKNRSSLAKRSISIVTSRGCPYKCCFCSIHIHMTRKYRTHSSSYVIRNIVELIDQYGIYRYHIEDDNLSLDRKRYKDIMQGMIELNTNIEWDTPNSMMSSSLDERLLDLSKMAGCRSLYISIESGSPRVIKEIIKKPINLKKVDRLVRQAQTIDIPLSAYYVIGFPGETIDEINSTINLALEYYSKYNVTPYMLMATPLPGTKLEHIATQQGMMPDNLKPSDYATGTQLMGRRILRYGDKYEKLLDLCVHKYLRSRKDIQAFKSINNC